MKQRGQRRRRLADDEGSATAEYAIATMATVVAIRRLLSVVVQLTEFPLDSEDVENVAVAMADHWQLAGVPEYEHVLQVCVGTRQRNG